MAAPVPGGADWMDGGAQANFGVASGRSGSPSSLLAIPGSGELAGTQDWTMPQLGGIEQKVSALSRRTAAEFRKAEKERSEHARRLEALEELCRQALGNLDYRLDQARVDAAQEVEKATHRVRGRLEQEMQKLAEGLERHTTEARDQRQGNSDSIRNLGKRVEGWHANLEELKSWRRETEEQLAEFLEASRSRTVSHYGPSHSPGDLSEQLDEQLEVALARDRKQAQERLRSSCAEITAHLNDMRRELVEQRRVAELVARDAEERHDRLKREVAARHSDLETQVAELGGALASRLQSKMAAMTKVVNERVEDVGGDFKKRLGAVAESVTVLESSSEWLGGQVQLWRRENAELHSELSSLKDPSNREFGQILTLAREEARTVHLEVMSLDTRVAAIEERITDDPSRRRYESMLRVSEKG